MRVRVGVRYIHPFCLVCNDTRRPDDMSIELGHEWDLEVRSSAPASQFVWW
jgi:hypothetical protein